MKFLIFLITVIAIALVVLLTWALAMKADGKCPLCALKHFGGSKLTMDIGKELYNNGADDTPIMGWSSWNTLRNHISQDDILQTASAMEETGLLDAGYNYINIDDCWQSSTRDENGMMQSDMESFPAGIERICKTLNEHNFKLGIYSSNGTLTCEDLPASLGNEELDAKTFASWGVELLKYDFCHNKRISGSTPIIEYISINTPGERANIQLKPEQAKFTGRAQVVKCTDLPSKKGIGFLNHNAGTAIFNTTVTAGGEYVMTVHYHKAMRVKEQYLQILVNNDKIYELYFPKGNSFTPDARAQIVVELSAGENTIKLQNPVVTRADSAFVQYKKMGNMLKDAAYEWADYTGKDVKPITYSICEWGFSKPYKWGRTAGNMWRTTMDIKPNWNSILHIYEKNIGLYKYAGPAHINDPDMLEVGNGKLTYEENKTHFTLWCMMAAPLILGNDVRKLLTPSKTSDEILNIVTNKSLILIDQDPMVKSAKRIKKGTIDILARPLSNGDVALCFFNKSSNKKAIDFEIDTLAEQKYLQFGKSPTGYQVHDIWGDERYHKTAITATLPKHGVKVYRISQ